MPIISDKMAKATKKAAKEEKKKKEEDEKRQREEQEKKEQEEKEAKEKEEQEAKEKKLAKRQKKKDRHDKAKKQKQELEKKVNMRKEMAFIRKALPPKQIQDEAGFERQGLTILRTELKSKSISKLYKAKHKDQENFVCEVIVLEKAPTSYKQNLPLALQILRYIGGGATDTKTTGGGSEPHNPGLVKVVDIFMSDKKAYIFTEEYETKSIIDTEFKKSSPSDENAVKSTVKQLAQILQYLHSIGVAHNHLKPSCLVRSKDNNLKLIGLSYCGFYWDPDMEAVIPKKKLHKKDFDKNSYLPPEAFKAETYDPSLADIWSLGVVMCFLIAKENPFKIKDEKPFDEQWRTFAQKKDFSDEAKQLLDKIFECDPLKRVNITEILEDSYFKGESTPKPAKETQKSAESGKEASKSAESGKETPKSADSGKETPPPPAPASETPPPSAESEEPPPQPPPSSPEAGPSDPSIQ